MENIQQKLRHATSLLEASGLDPPGIREKPLQDPSPEVRRILLEQFATKDIEQAWIPAYKQLILDNHDVFSLDKFDVGHTPHYHHRIERTTDKPIYVQQFKIPVVDEQALDEFATNLTAARVLVVNEQVISDHGGEFVSEVMDELNKLLRLKHHIISPYRPHVNGQVERVHQTMGDYLKKYCDNAPAEWTNFFHGHKTNTNLIQNQKSRPGYSSYSTPDN